MGLVRACRHTNRASITAVSVIQRIFLLMILTSFSLVLVDNAGIGGFHTDTGQRADFSRQGRNGVLGRVQSDGNDADFPFPVGNSHPSDDKLSIFMENAVEPFHRVGTFHDDAHHGYPCFHVPIPP